MAEDVLVDAVLASGVVLPTPSAGFLRLQAAIANEDAGPKELAAAVSQDPAITGALLRVAGSPVFRPRSLPRTAHEAISLLGRTRTMATAASTALRGQCSGIDARVIEALWAASAAAAEGAYAVCRASPFRTLGDGAYLAGLLQDAGLAVLLKRAPEHASLFEGGPMAVEAGSRALEALTGFDHSAAGYLVARNWKLPADTCDAIRAHGDPRIAARLPNDARRLVLILAAGRRVRDGASPDWAEWAEQCMDELRLSEDELDALSGAG